MNITKIEFIAYIYILFIKIDFNVGIKTVFFLFKI